MCCNVVMLDIRWICLTNGLHQNNTVKVTVSNIFISLLYFVNSQFYYRTRDGGLWGF